MPDVVLVSMPFGPVFSPSIGLSLLKAGLVPHGITATIRYFSIRFAEAIGQAFYSGIADEGTPALQDLVGEWLFAKTLFNTTPADDSAYVEELLRDYYSDALISRILRARDRVDPFLRECADVILRDDPKLVGFTSIFQQHVASLALARFIKQARPSTFVLFGGANCEGIMGAETVRSFAFVDAAVSGEADLVFPDIVKRVLQGQSLAGIPGVRTQEGIRENFVACRFDNAPLVRDMDSLPVPDYSDYFEQFRASRYDRDWEASVFLETSRGCWWGERMHCTFCGLNGATMAFRSKSAARALKEVTTLVDRHPGRDIQVVDNILDMRYFKDFIPALASRRLKVGFFYETKSNLNRQQVRLLRDSGIREIQPGIENFSDSVLKLMRKGVTGLQNIQLLKWCKEFGIEPSWNFLWGFPGESSQEYTRMASVVPLLMHLPPPVSCDDIRLDRFSPNYFDAERLGFTDVRPLPAYRHVYPLSAEAVSNLACYFAYRYREPQDVARYVGPLARQLEKWKRLKNRTDLFSVDCGRFLVIVDLRPTSRRPFVVLAGIERQLYCECDATRDLCQITGIAATDGSPAAPELIERTIAPLVEAGLLLRDGTRYLALAIPLGEYTPSPSVAREFWNVVRKRGIRQGHRWLVPAVRIGFVNREREMARRRVRNRDTRPGAARGNGTRRPGVCGRSVAPIAACQFSVDARGRLVIRASERSRTERSC